MNIRLAVAAAIVWYALGMPGLPSAVSVPPYGGGLAALHTESRAMQPVDRQGLAEALSAAAKMLEGDRAGLLKTTEDVKEFVRGVVAYGYTSFSVAKYPQVAAAVQAELEKAVGGEVTAVTPEIRSRTAAALVQAAEAVR